MGGRAGGVGGGVRGVLAVGGLPVGGRAAGGRAGVRMRGTTPGGMRGRRGRAIRRGCLLRGARAHFDVARSRATRTGSVLPTRRHACQRRPMARKKTRRRAKTGGPRETILEPLLRASAAQQKEWARTEKEIVRLREGGAALFDELWELVHEVMTSDPPRYLGGGMKTEREFIARVLPGEDKRSVARNTLVAVAFTPADEAEKGLGFLEEVAKYAQELSGSRELPRALDLDRFRVPVKGGGGSTRKKAARACTRDEVVAARNALGKKRRREAPAAETAIVKALKKRKALAGVKVRASATHASLTGIPLGELAKLSAALREVRLPD